MDTECSPLTFSRWTR